MESLIGLLAGLVLGTMFGFIFHDDIKNIFMR